MSNGEVCCILGVCCPPSSAVRRASFVSHVVAEVGMDPAHAEKMVDWLDVRFDFAPKGTMQPLIDAIAGHVRASHGLK